MSFESILPMMPRYSIVLEVDWQGKILESWHTNRTDFSRFSEAKIIVSINLNSNQYCVVKCICRLNHFNRNQCNLLQVSLKLAVFCSLVLIDVDEKQVLDYVEL